MVLTERPVGDGYNDRRKATERRIRDGKTAAEQAFPTIAAPTGKGGILDGDN